LPVVKYKISQRIKYSLLKAQFSKDRRDRRDRREENIPKTFEKL
jgi:hypothetical protein